MDDHRIVFLDVDGVLHALNGEATFDDSCMERLKRIVETSGAAIVLSSSWRQSDWGVEEVNSQLALRGLKPIVGCTPVWGFRSRSDEILDWIHRSEPPVTHFCALDDMDLEHPHGEAVGRHFVQTDSDEGLTDTQVADALEKLRVRVDAASLPAAEHQEERKW